MRNFWSKNYFYIIKKAKVINKQSFENSTQFQKIFKFLNFFFSHIHVTHTGDINAARPEGLTAEKLSNYLGLIRASFFGKFPLLHMEPRQLLLDTFMLSFTMNLPSNKSVATSYN